MKSNLLSILILCSFIIILTGCNSTVTNQKGDEHITADRNATSTSSSLEKNETSNQTFYNVKIAYKDNLDNWNVTPNLTKNSSGVQMVNVKLSFKGNVNVQMIKATMGNGKYSLPKLKNGDAFEIATSIDDKKEITMYLTWIEDGKSQTGDANIRFQ